MAAYPCQGFDSTAAGAAEVKAIISLIVKARRHFNFWHSLILFYWSAACLTAQSIKYLSIAIRVAAITERKRKIER